ncbi:MAG TPA: hypothetical protein VMG82_25740 [Candidatus Sulfotelmatobacter sp.]|nr:hypothetical protein [Candidatus Sulfotelmatobacter sp.]
MIQERRESDISKFSAEQEDRNPANRMVLRVVLTVIAAVAVLVLDAVTPLGFAVWLFQLVLVWIATLWANRRQLLALAAMCATFIVLGFWLTPKTRPVMWVDEANVLLSLGTVWALTHSCLRQRAAEDARRKAAQELTEAQETVRILSGILPICAWCKKIRNEGGTWEQLEIYVRNHSHAEFTHGICQECADRFNT